MANRGGSGAGIPGATRFATRRRFVVAFSIVLGGFLAALAFQVHSLRRMEATFAEMGDHEEEMRLALSLEDAVREMYLIEGSLVAGGAANRSGYELAHARALEAYAAVALRVDEPEAKEQLRQIREATAELDRVYREGIEPSPIGDPAAAVAHARSYRLISVIEQNVDDLFAELQKATSTSRQELAAVERVTFTWTLALAALAPFFVAGAVVYLSRSVARPLARLSRGAAAVAQGDLESRIDIDTPDEFGALAQEFNAMTAALKQQQERLAESEKLAGIGRLAAGVAHELNNPLQVMLGYLSLHRDVRDRRLARHLGAVEVEVLRCKEIVDGLAELTRPMARSHPVDLRELCEDVAAGVRISTSPGPPRLSTSGTALALGDRAKLRQVVMNLLRNAAEAAGPDGHVDVQVRDSGDQVEVAVTDDGPGISAEARTRLFEPFYTTKPSGTGLGLAVSRAIALAHGGDIDVANGAGRGAIFTVRLPHPAERGG